MQRVNPLGGCIYAAFGLLYARNGRGGVRVDPRGSGGVVRICGLRLKRIPPFHHNHTILISSSESVRLTVRASGVDGMATSRESGNLGMMEMHLMISGICCG